MKTKYYPPNPRLDKCQCNHFRYEHWGNKGKCLEYNYGVGFYDSTLSRKCECIRFDLKEKDKGFKATIEA